MDEYKVIGLSKISNNEDEQGREIEVTHIFLKKDRQKYLLKVIFTTGECYSGYCAAQWLELDLQEVTEFEPIQQIPIEPFSVSSPYNFQEWEKYIEFSEYDDGYYPTARFDIQEEMWKETPRKEEFGEPIYIFFGDSATGKSSIALKLFNKNEIIETDALEEPTDIFTMDYNEAKVIVIGNRHKNFKELYYNAMIFNNKVIEVEFRSEKK